MSKELNFKEVITRSEKIRGLYHELERIHHGSEWTVEEDALAFLTDAGLVGRLTMSQQGRWPKGGATSEELSHKLGESIWWLIILAGRMDIDINVALEGFLSKTEQLLKK
ncbi:nucleoside triphosphate pyrophosphohydrolase family protein [Mucilaginibacter agri]|uniref:MazG-like protein n=1 Tax=Mucilaginibacter agri TaxID=2695265 RepID=A0A965ZM15_9SPHI|nr:MazG-like protein [Mucilaginibacter agri]NCD72092.1 MazG-like protein [Mucilaginibacter agri]